MTPSPEALPAVPGLEAAGWTRPASINGGDCFDLWRLPDGRLAVMLADASGHGIAALVVSQVRTLARTLSETEPDPFSVLQRVNGRMYDDLPGGRFVTTFLGYVSAAGRIDWCSAGQSPILVRPDPAAPWRELPATVPPLGVLPELPVACGDAVHLARGGWLLVASDGITESIRPRPGLDGAPGAGEIITDGDLFGTARLLDTLAAGETAPPPTAVIEQIRAAMKDWQHGGEPVDDQTVVAVRRAG